MTMSQPAAPGQKPPLKVLLCSPRGFCAGVVRAINSVERALARYGAPVYVRHEIVHNRYVVESLKAKGAIFVEELDEIPDTGAPVIFSAHGVPKSIPEEAKKRNFFALDATCPLVTKVHREAEIHHKRGREIVLIGHADHPEVVGTLGQLPAGAITLVQSVAEVAAFVPRDPANLAYVTQTTLVGRRYRRHRRGAQGALSADPRTAQGGHLLRHHQPPGGGQEGGADGRGDGRGRLAQFLQHAAPQRGGRARRLSARRAGAARQRDRLVGVRLGSRASASPPARRRPKSWSRRSSAPSPSATR